MTLTVTLPEGARITNGRQITFRAPCDCTGVTGIIVGETTYSLVDTMEKSVGDGGVFKQGSLVSVVLDTENSKAYLVTTAIIGVVDNLSSSDPAAALSANQGRVINNLISEKLAKSNVVNNLTTADAGYALDARQGKALSDSVSSINTSLSSKLNTANVANNLTTTGSGYALDARQGKALNDKISGKLDTSKIIYSSSTPTVVNGAIWLKPKG